LYIRREIAKDWGIPPWEVDDAPEGEVALELQFRRIEAAAQPQS